MEVLSFICSGESFLCRTSVLRTRFSGGERPSGERGAIHGVGVGADGAARPVRRGGRLRQPHGRGALPATRRRLRLQPACRATRRLLRGLPFAYIQPHERTHICLLHLQEHTTQLLMHYIIINPLQSTAGHRPLQFLAIPLDFRLLASSSCQPSCANGYSIWPEDVLHYVYRDAVSTPELVYLSDYRLYC
jgi:hypothetical protein